MVGNLRSRARRAVRGVTKRHSRVARLAEVLGPWLPEVTCVDVGASYYAHPKWRLFLSSPCTRWIAVEPNEVNLSYLRGWPWPARVEACTTGLSHEGGEKTLFVTNTDSGSSLLEPVVTPSMSDRITDLSYHFPVRPVKIETITLDNVIGAGDTGSPVVVKLDTQGTELSILTGAVQLFADRRIVGIEMESTLQADPVMRGSGKFWEACRFLEDQGLELLEIIPIFGPSRFSVDRPGGRTFLNECDAVFGLRTDLAREQPVESRAALLAFHLSYAYFEEALSTLERDRELAGVLEDRGCDVGALIAVIRTFAAPTWSTRLQVRLCG